MAQLQPGPGVARRGGLNEDYRPPTQAEATKLAGHPLPDWLRADLEAKAIEQAAIHLVPPHLNEIRRRKEELIDRNSAAVHDRLTKEINMPRDVRDQNLGYDIESAMPGSCLFRFLEAKGRAGGAKTVTITKNEILTGLNNPEQFILAVVILDTDQGTVRYVHTPFEKESDFKATSVNYDLTALLARAEEPA